MCGARVPLCKSFRAGITHSPQTTSVQRVHQTNMHAQTASYRSPHKTLRISLHNRRTSPIKGVEHDAPKWNTVFFLKPTLHCQVQSYMGGCKWQMWGLCLKANRLPSIPHILFRVVATLEADIRVIILLDLQL